MDSSSCDLKSITTDMHNHTLADANENINDAEGRVIEYTRKNIVLIVNNSGVHQIEYGHDDEHIKHIGEVARFSMQFISFIIEIVIGGIFFRISISNSS